MKPTAIFIFLVFATSARLLSQELDFWNRCGDTFDPAPYPTDSFSMRRDTYPFAGTDIILTILRFNGFEVPEDQVWVEQRKSGQLLKSRYLGGIGNESGVALISENLYGHFVIGDFGEFTGRYYFMSPVGIWHQLPGSDLYSNPDRSLLITSVPAECGGCLIGRLDLKTGVLKTRMSNGSRSGWEEFEEPGAPDGSFYEREWVKW